MLERAEVAAALPDVLVLTPEDAAEAASWPEFSPAVITAEGRRRGEMYAQRRRRQEEARAFGGSRDDFLRHVGTAGADRPGRPGRPAPAARAVGPHPPVQHRRRAGHRGPSWPPPWPTAGQRLVAVWLRDHFGDDGLVGGA